MEGGNIGFLPGGGKLGCLVNVVEEFGKEGQATWASTI